MADIGETELNVRALARALWRRSWLLVLLAVLAAVGTYVALGHVEPVYTADTRILIEQREYALTRPADAPNPPSTEFDASAIQSQVEVLKSREIADSVIDKLHLTQNPDFDPARHPSPLRALKVMLGLGGNPTESSIRQRVMDTYFARLSVYPLQQSRVIGVDFSAPDPALAAKVANAIANAFVALQQDAKRQSAIAATSWLKEEIDRLQKRVAESEKAIADYRTSHGLFEVDQGGSGSGSGATLSTQQLSDINAELARARAARAEAEARANLVENLLKEGKPLDASQEVLNSPLIQRLRERQVALEAQIAELSTTLLPGHPRIRALKEQVANLDVQIRDEAKKVLVSLQTAARVAAAREQSLVKSLNQAKIDVSRTNDQGIGLRALERDAAAQRSLLESFLTRYREASARTDANYLPADARIISEAVPPSDPSFPKKGMMSVAVAIVVLLIGAAIVLLAEFVSGRAFRVIGSGFTYRALPVAADDPRVVLASGLVAEEEPEEEAGPSVAEAGAAEAEAEPAEEPLAEEAAEAEGVAVAHGAEDEEEAPGTAGLADILANSSVRVALFAGAEGGEGAGEIAFSAAGIVSEDKVRCVLVDIGRKPSEALGLERPGLGDLLSGEAAFGEVIRRDDDTPVHVIPLGGLDEHPPMQRMQLVIGALTHTYDKVIVVADRLDDWPHEHVRPDLVAIVCSPDSTEELRTEVYDTAIARGAKSALIVRLSGDGMSDSEAA